MFSNKGVWEYVLIDDLHELHRIIRSCLAQSLEVLEESTSVHLV